METSTGHVNLLAGWAGMLLGVLSGAVIGARFHKPDWAGGYGSFRRRLVRLGHISFFGLGFLNVLFALSAGRLAPGASTTAWAGGALVLGAITMPLCCFLTAWKVPFRWLFPVPVLSVGVGVALVLWSALA
jgi:hypothetical protein